MLVVNLVKIGSFVLDESTGITFLDLVKSEVIVLDVLLLSSYSDPYGMEHLSNIELNLTHFYTNPNF